MNYLNKIKPSLLSDDLLVQNFAVQALEDYYWFVPEEWTEMLLEEALNSEKKEETILLYIDKLPFSDRAVKLLIKGVNKAGTSKKHLYLQLLANLEPEMALQYQKELEPYMNQAELDFYHFLQNGTEEEIRNEYARVLDLLEQEQYHNQNLYSQAKRFAKTIVKKGWMNENEIDENLQKQLGDKYFSYEGILMIYMIGLMGLPKYIPLLVTLLDRDEDILLEETADALISFQSDVVVELVKPYAILEASSVFAISILSGTKTAFATEVLKELMREVEYEDDLSLVFEGLCRQLSVEALPEIEQYLQNDPESYMIEVEETAYGFYRTMGVDHPKLDRWKQIIEENNRRQQEGNLFTQPPLVSSEKVGRNDPCPCDSGKKFKKCCGA